MADGDPVPLRKKSSLSSPGSGAPSRRMSFNPFLEGAGGDPAAAAKQAALEQQHALEDLPADLFDADGQPIKADDAMAALAESQRQAEELRATMAGLVSQLSIQAEKISQLEAEKDTPTSSSSSGGASAGRPRRRSSSNGGGEKPAVASKSKVLPPTPGPKEGSGGGGGGGERRASKTGMMEKELAKLRSENQRLKMQGGVKKISKLELQLQEAQLEVVKAKRAAQNSKKYKSDLKKAQEKIAALEDAAAAAAAPPSPSSAAAAGEGVAAEVESLTAANAELETRVESLVRELDGLAHERDTLAARIDTMGATLSEATAANGELEAHVDELEATVSDLKKDAAVKSDGARGGHTADIAQLQEALVQAKADAKALTIENIKLSDALEAAGSGGSSGPAAASSDSSAEIAQLQAALAQTKADAKTLTIENTKLSDALEAATTTAAASTNDTSDLEAELATARADAEEASQVAEESFLQAQDLRAQLEAANKRIASLEDEVETALQEAMAGDGGDTGGGGGSSSEDLAAAQEAVVTANDAIKDLEARLATAEEAAAAAKETAAIDMNAAMEEIKRLAGAVAATKSEAEKAKTTARDLESKLRAAEAKAKTAASATPAKVSTTSNRSSSSSSSSVATKAAPRSPAVTVKSPPRVAISKEVEQPAESKPFATLKPMGSHSPAMSKRSTSTSGEGGDSVGELPSRGGTNNNMTVPVADRGRSMSMPVKKKGGWKPPQLDKCKVCGKTVYEMEKIIADKIVYHKTCFRCSQCKKAVSLGTYAALEGKIFCKPHFKQLFKLKGNYSEGFGKEQHKHKWDHKAESSDA